jgi:hypothetical protein
VLATRTLLTCHFPAGYGDFDPRLYPFYHVVGLHKSNPLVAGRPMAACGSCLEVQCRGTNVSSSCQHRPVGGQPLKTLVWETACAAYAQRMIEVCPHLCVLARF